jgi:hypothetical protein
MKWLIELALGPFFNMLVNWRKAELEAKGSHEAKEENIALRSLELDQMEARLNSDRKNHIDGKWYAIENLFAYAIALPYWFQVITLDFIIFPWVGYDHTTAPLKGETAVVMGMIMAFWFGKRAINTVGNVLTQVFGRR